MKLLAADPGESTGIAFFEDGVLKFTRTITSLSELWSLLISTKPTHLVSESFRLYPGKAAAKMFSGFPEIEVIGVIRLYTILNKIILREQPASKAKTAWPDERLKQVKAKDMRGLTKHEKDAIRHGLCYLHDIERKSR